VSVYTIAVPEPSGARSYRCVKCTSHGRRRLRSRRASVSKTNRVGLEVSVTTERSWNVSSSFAPVEVKTTPTVARPSEWAKK